MFKSIFKTAWRVLKKERLFATINIFGLAVGLCASLLIFLWVQYEMSYDKHHEYADSIYRVITIKDAGMEIQVPVSAPALAPHLAAEYGEVAAASHVRFTSKPLEKAGDKASVAEMYIAFTDVSFLNCFSHTVVQGSVSSDWNQTESIVLTASAARRYFGESPAIGETMIMQGQSLRVAAVVEDAPGPSHIDFDVLIPLGILEKMDRRLDLQSWQGLVLFSYVRLNEYESAETFEAKIRNLMNEHVPQTQYQLKLQKLRDIHLRALEGTDPIRTIQLYAGFALFILIVAAINFVNLATARSSRRCLEVGLRKTLGARRSELMLQFQGEAFLQTGIAFAIALTLSALLLPEFNALTGNQLKLNTLIINGRWVLIIAIPVLLGFIAGFYPSWILSAFKPRQVMNKGGGHRFSHHFRQGLVILQFVLSLILFIGALGVSRQLQYLQDKPLGFDEQHLLYSDMQAMSVEGFDGLRAELCANPAIESVTRTNVPLLDLGFETNYTSWEGQRPEQKVNVQIRTADAEYLSTMKMSMAEGRFFEAGRGVDQGQTCVLNEAAIRIMELQNPVGKYFVLADTRMQIIGIVKDFHHHSMHTEIEPLVFINWPQFSSTLFVRINDNQQKAAMDYLESVWPRIQPDEAFSVQYFSDSLDSLYHNERNMSVLVQWLGGLAVLVACLGLVGLTTYTVETVRKEIGIRKVMGATARSIVLKITGQYTKWVLLAVALSWPLSYWLLGYWLAGFAYRTPLSWDLFLSGGLTILILAALTVSGLVLRAAMVPPVQTLRHE
ncbi:ABC transporter permease [bacterium]|nr:ABC transporter permease [bacterium]